MSVVLIVLLSVWLLITVLAQRRFTTSNRLVYAAHWLRWHDYCGLIGVWAFFIPDPALSDYRVLYRDQIGDGHFTPWTHVELQEARLVQGIWNPGMRRRKAVVDMCSRLEQMAGRALRREPSKDLFISVPYLALLQHVKRQPRGALGDSRQFMITRPGKELDIVFISPLHAL